MTDKTSNTEATTKNTKPAESKFAKGSLHQLTRNAGGHLVGETFTADEAEASGIASEHFRPFDRAIKQPSR